eukprot:scaffold5323_cov173-Amphora_coffeaeformis.AAC.1
MPSTTTTSSSPSSTFVVESIETAQGLAYLIDLTADNVAENVLHWMDDFRLSLPLDSKRPTVQRRFFADGRKQPTHVVPSLFATPPRKTTDWDPTRPIAHWIETVLRPALAMVSSSVVTTATTTREADSQAMDCCHVFRYQRFLEYTRVGSQLATHTDGTKICDETGRQSTHTLLLYLTDCPTGGETRLMLSSSRKDEEKGCRINHLEEEPYYDVHPKRGRILLFPHATPHAGAPVVATPKICLRAEVAIIIHHAIT